MQFLFVVAPATVLAAILFFFMYEDFDAERGLERHKSNVKQAEFNEDFAAAWGGDNVAKPDVKIKVDALDGYIEYLADYKVKKAEREQKMEALRSALVAELERDEVPIDEIVSLVEGVKVEDALYKGIDEGQDENELINALLVDVKKEVGNE
jgi:hypothetical protein